MLRKHLLLAMTALLGACSDKPAPLAAQDKPAVAPASASASSVPTRTPTAPGMLRTDGVGAVRFGMTLEQAEEVLGAKAEVPTAFDPACSMVRFAALPTLRFMVENGVVTRADAEAGATSAVGAIGDTAAQVRAAHPEADISPHKYDANGQYLSFPSADGRSAIILETSGGKVSKMRAGLQPAVGYVETCG